VPGRELTTTSAEETEALGEALGRAARGGELIGLIGELGTGKTCLVRGLARGLDVDPERVHSPSFTIVTEYPGGRLPLAHVDLYRLEVPADEAPFLRDVLYGEGVAAVEWFDRLVAEGDEEVLLITLSMTSSGGRAIRLEARGSRHQRLVERAALA
jgi:tRNA threonylcarbamoyladenosine biosynthesis protein TsaE